MGVGDEYFAAGGGACFFAPLPKHIREKLGLAYALLFKRLTPSYDAGMMNVGCRHGGATKTVGQVIDLIR